MKTTLLKEIKYREWIFILSVSGIAVSFYLVYNEINTPGYCPKYPVINEPACYFVLSFFIAVFVSACIKNKLLAQLLSYLGNIAGIITALWFSINHLLDNVQCPVILGIPLCMAALITFLILLILFLRQQRS